MNRSQIEKKNIKHVIFEPGKNIYFSTYPPPTLIHMAHRFTSALRPAAQKFLTVILATYALPFHHLRLSKVLERISRPSCEPLYAANTSHRKQETFFMSTLRSESFLPQK
jgi:hypothetical protein